VARDHQDDRKRAREVDEDDTVGVNGSVVHVQCVIA
jgi:hypothetical protein